MQYGLDSNAYPKPYCNVKSVLKHSIYSNIGCNRISNRDSTRDCNVNYNGFYSWDCTVSHHIPLGQLVIHLITSP